MEFTYNGYTRLIESLDKCDYVFTSYNTWSDNEQTVILRHDVDYDLQKTTIFSELEYNLSQKLGKKLGATYFVLVSSDFYNLLSQKNIDSLKRIINNGGSIGLHFDIAQYDIVCNNDINQELLLSKIEYEKNILESIIQQNVESISFHRPINGLIEKDLSIPGLINSYSDTFFKQMKYVSDSHRNWREDICSYIEKREYDRLHILTHPFWYHDEEISLRDTLKKFCMKMPEIYYGFLKDNFRDIEDVLKEEEIYIDM